VPFNFSWVIDGVLAGMARPGSGLEKAGEMNPVERRFLSWLAGPQELRIDRKALVRRISLEARDDFERDRRLIAIYKKFRDIWGILESYREGMGPGGEAVDGFCLDPAPLRQDLQFLKDQGIGAIVTLSENPLDEARLAEFGFEAVHIPLQDRRAPEQGLIDVFVRYVDRARAAGVPVVAHCLGGYGRTGTMLACYLVRGGAGAEEAIAEVRAGRPGAVEPGEQEEAVRQYERRIRTVS
jgi:atypical dual specificity phosphatase